ncbi:hypothetical protein ACHAXT_000827 [Thalassiosira profunda]
MVQTRNGAKRIKASLIDAALSNDVLFGVAPYLEYREFVNLALVSRRFGSKFGGDCSLMEDVARQIIGSLQTEEERAALPRYGGESWLALLPELQKLRSPLAFNQLVGRPLEYVDGSKSCITTFNPTRAMFDDFDDTWTGYEVTALCNNSTMRAGKHYATFTITGSVRCFYASVGVMRPVEGLDQRGCHEFSVFGRNNRGWVTDIKRSDRWGSNGIGAVDVSFYDVYMGYCWSLNFGFDRAVKDESWGGMEGFEIVDGEVGLLLDLDEGTLAVYKNGRRLGIMQEGLEGEYCWAASVCAQFYFPPHEQNVRIERGSVPATG